MCASNRESTQAEVTGLGNAGTGGGERGRNFAGPGAEENREHRLLPANFRESEHARAPV